MGGGGGQVMTMARIGRHDLVDNAKPRTGNTHNAVDQGIQASAGFCRDRCDCIVGRDVGKVDLIDDAEDGGRLQRAGGRRRPGRRSVLEPEHQICGVGTVESTADALAFDHVGGFADACGVADDDRKAVKIEVNFDDIAGGSRLFGDDPMLRLPSQLPPRSF